MFCAMRIGCLLLLSGSVFAAEPARELPACLGGQIEKLPAECRQEVEALIQQAGALKLERDAALQQVRLLEERRLGGVGEVEPLGPEQQSSEGTAEARWGMDFDQVKALFVGAQASKTRERLSVGKTVADRPAHLHLVFVDQRLVGAEVEFKRSRFGRVEELVEEHNRLKGLLSDKYDLPKLDETGLTAHGKASDSDTLGKAALGRVALTTTWETPKTRIVLSCEGKLWAVRMKILYSSLEMAAGQKKKILEGL